MAKLVKFSLLGILLLFSLSSAAPAFDMEKAMCTYYGGLADILERNMKDPDKCVAEIDTFLKQNQELVIEMQKQMDENRKKAQERQYEDMSQEEIKEKLDEFGQAMAASKGFQEMNRFTEALSNFSMRDPEHGQKIGDLIEEYIPQPEEGEY